MKAYTFMPSSKIGTVQIVEYKKLSYTHTKGDKYYAKQ